MNFQHPVANLDGGEGCSEDLIMGTDIDLSAVGPDHSAGEGQPASVEGHGTEQPASVEGHGTEQPASVEGHGTEQPASVEGHGTEQPASVEGHGKMHDVQMKPVIEEEGTQNLHVEERASAEKPDEAGGVYIEADGNVQP